MASRHRGDRAAAGFSVKSGWASAVLVVGTSALPAVAASETVELSDPAVPESRQPYHHGFGTARAAGRELSRLIASVERFGGQSVKSWLGRLQAGGHDLQGAGVVVGSLIDPASIANDHIRIHALEGQLFRRVVAEAAGRLGVACSIWRERDLYGIAATALSRSEPDLRATLAALGRDIAGPWRGEQKRAVLAAWLVLAGAEPTGRRVRRQTPAA